MINREGYYVSDTERECTSCGVIFAKTSLTVALCPTCNSTRVKGQTLEKKMVARARSRAKNSGLEFDLSVDDIVIPEVCPILGVELVAHAGASGGRPFSPALDRKDNAKGYTKDNIQVLSHRANMMKSDASVAELVKFAQWVLRTFGTEVAHCV